MRVLVLRPERAAKRTAEALRALGHEAVVAPVLTIEEVRSPIPDVAFDGVLATSANGLRKLKDRPEIAALSRLALVAVGDRTAEAGREAGFATIHVAEGDGRALVSEVKARFAPPTRFLHAAGADRAFDVAGALARHGYDVTVVELYKASAATSLPEPAARALRDGAAGAALHHSRRIAETFVALCDRAGLGTELRALPHAALAPRVAEALREAGCAHVAVAERPDEPALLEAVRRLVGTARNPAPTGLIRSGGPRPGVHEPTQHEVDMADRKGPETGPGAKGGQSARPRSPTLDLSATDVTPKTAAQPKPGDPPKTADAPKPAAPEKGAEPSRPAAQERAAESSKAASSAPSGAASAESRPADPAPATGALSASAATSAASAQAAAKSEPSKPEPARSDAAAAGAARPDPAKPDPAKPEPAKPDAPAAATSGPTAAAAARSSATRFTTPSAPPPREGVGVLGVLAAAVGGAALAVLVIAMFGKSLIRAPEPDMSRVTAAETKLDAVGRDVAALRGDLAKTAQSTDTSAIDARLGEMSKSIEAQNGKVGGVETELRALAEQASKPPLSDPALGVLAGRIDGLELRYQEAPTPEALTVLGGRVAGVESRIGELPTKDALAGLESRIAALPSKDALAGVAARLEAVGQSVEGVGQKITAANAPLAGRVDQLSATLAERPKGDPAARLVVALGALDQALGAGRPFVAELAAVKSAAGGNAELAPLDPYAASGVPTRAALGAQLSAELSKLAAPKAAGEPSVFERFVANAGGVVKVTPKGGATGDDPASVRQRVAAQGASGDLEGALAARGQLDEPARAATEEWSRLATARVSAENAIDAARTAALGRLSAND